MKEFLSFIVKNLVDKPEKVKIKQIEGEQSLMLEVSVDQSDIGKIIGKGGKTIEALRILSKSIGSRHKRRVVITVLDEDDRGSAFSRKEGRVHGQEQGHGHGQPIPMKVQG